MSDLIGKTLKNNYVIVEQLDVGGTAQVYKAHQSSLSRDVAIKILRSNDESMAEIVERFVENEAPILANLRHSNIIQVYDFGYEDDMHYMVMELIEGPTLETELKERLDRDQPYTLAEILRILRTLASAIDHAHAQGVIHRDLKPANIMFASDGQVVLTDFGLARLMNVPRQTDKGVVLGTDKYMSPEQVEGDKNDDKRSDIYSLGVILYEMVTGQVPFAMDTPLDIIKHVNEAPILPTTIKPDVPKALEKAILKALNKNPADRYQTIGDMAHALTTAIETAQEQTAPTQISQPAATVISDPVDSSMSPFIPKKRVKIETEGDFASLSAEQWSTAIAAFAAVVGVSPAEIEVYGVYGGSIIFDLGILSAAIQRLHELLQTNDNQLRLLKVKKVTLEESHGVEVWVYDKRQFQLIAPNNQNFFSKILKWLRRLWSSITGQSATEVESSPHLSESQRADPTSISQATLADKTVLSKTRVSTTTPPQSEPAPQPKPSRPKSISGPHFIVVKSENLDEGDVIPIPNKAEISIGRDGRNHANDIHLPDNTVSRKHARLELSGQEYTIIDVKPLFKTKVDGEEAGKEKGIVLKDGAQIELGRKTTLEFKKADPTLPTIEEEDPFVTQ